ncbi:MAG: glycosyltransferase, partial [Chroococcidiopsidaceae cyanobacterium CP_BM_RX_35]|nr:glycosyltransferase [Chroococcidiopsidaceae cyanobacterium CP_BM_RX_35]
MTHFGIICPGSTGHLNTILPLGCELKQRGHHVTLFGVLDAQPKTLAAGLNFWTIGESEFPAGATARSLTQLGKLNGLAALQYTVTLLKQTAAILLREAPVALRKADVEALLVDQATSWGGTVAEYLNLPFINVCSALVLNQEDSVPPFFTPWSYNQAWWARLRNRAGYSLVNSILRPTRQLVIEHRRQWKLPPYSSSSDALSKLAIVSQQPAEFEFPRQHLPKVFHFTGPYHNSASRESIFFPFEKLTGQRLIYASMGTLQNRSSEIFRCIAEACAGLDAQLVISLGGGSSPESLPELPGSPLVVEYAPQLELLAKASLTITHAGLNTTLESLSKGVPMVAIPVTNDQPGVGARIAWSGAGEVVQLSRLSVPMLRAAVKRVLTEDSYKKNASRL